MPQIIPYIGVTLMGAGVSVGTAFAIGTAVYTGLYYAATTFILNKALGILNKRGKTGEGRGLEVALTDSTASGIVIFGEVRTSGVNMIPPVTSGADGRYLHQILAFAVHEIDSYQTHYFDQDTLPTPAAISGAIGDGAISSGEYSGAAWVRGYTGTMSQNVDYRLNNAFPSEWASTARGRGFPYVAYTYDWGKGKVYKGVPQPTVKLRGAKVYDPRLDTTNGGSGAHRYATPSTWAYSNNPALCWANYRMADYGFDVDPATEINWPSVAAAADICDALVDNKDGGTSKRYTCNGRLINEPENLQDNEQKIIDSMLGRRTFVNGQWHIYAGAWTVPTWSIAATDWLSIESIDTVSGFEQGGRFNEVHCFFINPTRNWQRVEAYVRRNTTYISDDAGRTLPIEMEQPLCTDESEAQRKAEFLLRASRNGIKLVGTLPPRFHGIKTYETVALTFAELGWVSKTFRVVAMSLFMDGSVRVALSEEQEADWTDLDTAEYTSPSLAAIPPQNPTKPSAVVALSATSYPGAIDVLWEESAVKPLGMAYRLMEASVNSYEVALERWMGDATRKVLTKPNTQTFYYWVDAVGANGSYSTFPGVSSGVPGAATLTDAVNLALGAVGSLNIAVGAIGSANLGTGVIGTGNIAPGAVSWATQVNCLVTQTHSSVGGISGVAVAELNIDPSSITYDGFIDIFARSDFGNSRATVSPPNNQFMQLLGKVGANSYYYIGSGSIIPQSYQTGDAMASFNAYGTFPVTANNSVAAYLLWWWQSSGGYGFMHREDILRAEFRKR